MRLYAFARLCVFFSIIFLSGCGEYYGGNLFTPEKASASGLNGGSSNLPPHPGAAQYNQQCANCHGFKGEGGIANALLDTQSCPTCTDLNTLAFEIESTMPPGNPGRCSGQCAVDTADYILSRLIPAANNQLPATPVASQPASNQPVTTQPTTQPAPAPAPVTTLPATEAELIALGKSEYDQQCASCHGSEGVNAILGPDLRPKECESCRTLETLAAETRTTMPPNNETACGSNCSTAVATYLFKSFIEAELANPAPTPVVTAPVNTTPPPPVEDGNKVIGKIQFDAQCKNCHGENGEGQGQQPALRSGSCTSCSSLALLKQVIETTMPKAMPNNCGATCATDIATYLFRDFIAPQQVANVATKSLTSVTPIDLSACRAIEPASRELLTSFEYVNTVRDLLGVSIDLSQIPVGTISGIDKSGSTLKTGSQYYAYQQLADEIAIQAIGINTEWQSCQDDTCINRLLADFASKLWRRTVSSTEVDALFANNMSRDRSSMMSIALSSLLRADEFLFKNYEVAESPIGKLSPSQQMVYENSLRFGTAYTQSYSSDSDGTRHFNQLQNTNVSPYLDSLENHLLTWLQTSGHTNSMSGSCPSASLMQFDDATVINDNAFTITWQQTAISPNTQIVIQPENTNSACPNYQYLIADYENAKSSCISQLWQAANGDKIKFDQLVEEHLTDQTFTYRSVTQF